MKSQKKDSMVKNKKILELEKKLCTKPESYWIKRGEKMALNLFREMAQRVPAYKYFLKTKKISSSRIKTFIDFKNVPLINKDNYLRKYPLEKLCWDGKFSEKSWDISATSGSTGQPFYFPRTDEQNKQYALTAELYLRNNFQIQKKSTLYINCWALGIWIGGIFTYEALKLMAEKNRYSFTIVNPGLNKIEVLKIIKNLGNEFDQIIIGSYPPFLKDVIDDGILYGIKWKKYDLGFIFSGEGFSEEFRKHIADKAGIKNIFSKTLSHYGTVDQGTLAHETPLSILIKKFIQQRRGVLKQVFDSEVSCLPTLVQYRPEDFFFESVNGSIICSSYSGLPLVRYDLKDNGGVLGYDSLLEALKNIGFDSKNELAKVSSNTKAWRLPFVYVRERRDLSVSLAGAAIYPETIKKALHDKLIKKSFTGKFTMLVRNDRNFNPFLEINLELKNGIKKATRKMVNNATGVILAKLLKENSEFNSVFHDQKGGGAIPKIVCWTYEHDKYFKGEGKQKWIKRTGA